MRRYWWILLIIVIFFTKLYWATKFFHVDIWSNAGWGQWIAENGSKGFFYNNVWVYSWPTQLPLIDLIYSWCFTISLKLMALVTHLGLLLIKLHVDFGYHNLANFLGSPITKEIPFHNIFLLTIKLFPILGDFAIAYIIFRLANKKWMWPIIYLLSPFSWYLSAFWGQYDQISFLFLILSFLTIKKIPYLSPAFLSVSLGIKPTSAIFIPFYLLLLWEERKNWKQYLLGAIIGIGLNIYWISLFSQEKTLWKFINGRLMSAVIYKSEPRVTVNSYNLWHLFLGDKATNVKELFLGIQYQIWGIMGIIATNIYGIWIYFKSKNRIWLSLSIIGIGSWMVGMNMLERYLFAGIVFGLIATIREKWLLKPWILLSLIFWINLYKNWWQPPILDFLRTMQEKTPVIPQVIFPTINLLLFAYIIYATYSKTRKA